MHMHMHVHVQVNVMLETLHDAASGWLKRPLRALWREAKKRWYRCVMSQGRERMSSE